MISRSANSSSRNGSTASRVAGPPRLRRTMPVLTERAAPAVAAGSWARPLTAVSLLTHQSGFECKAGKSGDGPDSQFPHQALPVGLDGAMADPEGPGDFLV